MEIKCLQKERHKVVCKSSFERNRESNHSERNLLKPQLTYLEE